MKLSKTSRRPLLQYLQIFENEIRALKFRIKWKLGLIKKATDKYISERELTFEDDFNNNELDRNKWNTTFDWGRHDFNNLTWTTDGKNLEFSNSILRIFAKSEPGTKTGWWGTINYEFTIGSINTCRKFEQTYGRFECKAKLDNHPALWPAFWTLTVGHTHPDAPNNHERIMPEIDIMEGTGNGGWSKKYKKSSMSLHYGLSYEELWHKSDGTATKGINYNNNYYIFAVEWKKDRLEWFINNEKVKVLRFKYLESEEIPIRPMYLILGESVNLERGRKYKDSLPAGLWIDWVRAYK